VYALSGLSGLSGFSFFRVNKVSEDLNFLFESTCKVVLFGKVPAAKKLEKHDKHDQTDPINSIKRTRGVRTLGLRHNKDTIYSNVSQSFTRLQCDRLRIKL